MINPDDGSHPAVPEAETVLSMAQRHPPVSLLGIFATAILPIVAVAAAGYALGRYRDVEADALNTITVYVLAPALVVHSLATSQLTGGTILAVVGAVALFTAVMLAVGEAVGRAMGQTEPVLGAFVLVTVFPNTGNYGIPLADFVFGPTGRSVAVLVTALEMDETVLRRGATLPEKLTVSMPEHGITVAPDLAVLNPTNSDEPLLLIHVYEPVIDLDATRRFDGLAITPADRMVALLRSTGCPIGIVTNGERWMLVHAPAGAVAGFASWYARLWGQEPETLRAFVSLLGVRRFFGPDEGKLPALYERSLKHQDDVTEALGEQVRRAVEVLVQALGRADQDRNRELLRDVDPRELELAAVFVAAVTDDVRPLVARFVNTGVIEVADVPLRRRFAARPHVGDEAFDVPERREAALFDDFAIQRLPRRLPRFNGSFRYLQAVVARPLEHQHLRPAAGDVGTRLLDVRRAVC